MSQDDPHATADLAAAPPDTELSLSACWSQSGVYGDSSCPELHQFVHCRNCPVYSAAAIRLLDRPLPPNYRREWTQHFAEQKQHPAPGGISVVLFRIQAKWLALPTHSFQEIAEKRPVHSLPNRPGSIVLGLANVRGELVTCVSLGHLLGIEPMPAPHVIRLEYRHLLIVQWEANKLAFPVDEVHGPNRFSPQDFRKLPSTVSGTANPSCAKRLLSWQNRTVGLLDPDLLPSRLSQYLA